MSKLFYAALIALCLALAVPVRAQTPPLGFTPESGWYWNPAEPGYGFSIEIQDNFIFMVAFAYGPGGATWYAAEGLMPTRTTFAAPLYRRDVGTCLGCPFVPASPTYAVGQNISIVFTSETTATLTWAGRTIPIRRHDYYLSRRNPPADPKTELWLGEWQVVMDFYNIPDERNLPYFGEILVFDLLDTSGNPDFADGCRPHRSRQGFCNSASLASHDASTFYSPSDAANFIVVNDTTSTWLVMEVEVGTSQFDGYAKVCPKTISAGNLISQCLDSNLYAVLPARGWRSGSRAWVQGNDNAPSGVPSVSDKAAAPAWRDLSMTIDPAVAQAMPVRQRANLAETEALMHHALTRMQARDGQTTR